MAAQLEAIVFNHDPLSPVNGLNLRRDASEAIPLPEWRRAAAGAGSFAAYATSEAHLATPTIRLQLRRIHPAVTTLEVRAVQPAGVRNVLGGVRARRVTFRPDGTSGFQTFALDGPRLRDAGVGVHWVRWRWQFRPDPQQPWIDFAETTHRVYTVLGVPGAPWQQSPSGPANTQLPWTMVLDHACGWAAGAQTLDEAATRVTQAVFALGPEIVEYGCPILGATQYSLPIFQCTAFLDRLSGGLGRGRYVNCTDCATIVSTFANALGCRLSQSQMWGDVPFALNETIAIGDDVWRTACDWGAFNYHEVAWKEPCTADEEVFDACLLVDGDADPTRRPHQPLLPVNMRFGRPGDGGYCDRLAAPAGRPQCRPQPQTRQQRFVV
jgi:hypothetical protein